MFKNAEFYAGFISVDKLDKILWKKVTGTFKSDGNFYYS